MYKNLHIYELNDMAFMEEVVVMVVMEVWDIPWEVLDRKFTHEDWSSIKSDAPFGKAPWIEYNGKKLAESAAICRYLSRKYGLAGKDDWEQAQVDALFDLYKDFGTVVQPYFMVMFGRQQGDKVKTY
uniref:glutathione transferase n=1 Tax=Acrobeloides nanus TaxID=290746 RepID=A0A914BYX5_9BILA